VLGERKKQEVVLKITNPYFASKRTWLTLVGGQSTEGCFIHLGGKVSRGGKNDRYFFIGKEIIGIRPRYSFGQWVSLGNWE